MDEVAKRMNAIRERSELMRAEYYAQNGSRTLATITQGYPGGFDCAYLGKDTGQRKKCPTCTGHIELKVFECRIFGECTTNKRVDGSACCALCAQFKAKDV